MATQHDKQFKLDAIQYYQDHKDLGVRGCAENLGIGYSTLTNEYYPLGHSFSKNFFNEKFHSENIDAEYVNFEIPSIKELPSVLLADRKSVV